MDDVNIIYTKDGSTSLFDSKLKETYHSTHGAIQESQHVFIEAGLHRFLQNSKARNVSILEIGFGTGLNALLTSLAAEKMAVKIEYETIEAYPLAMETVARLNYTDMLGADISKSSFDSLHQAEWDTFIEISRYFYFLKRNLQLEEADFVNEKFDLVFFDAFSPDKQPEMWDLTNLRKVTNAMKSQGIFTTYSAKGQLKRDLISLGLLVEKIPGPPGKREMIRATKP